MSFVDLSYIVTVAGGTALATVVAAITLFLVIFKIKNPGMKTRSWVLPFILLLALEAYIIVGIYIFYGSGINLKVSESIDNRFHIIALVGLVVGLALAVATFVLARIKVLSTRDEQEPKHKSLFKIDRYMQ